MRAKVQKTGSEGRRGGRMEAREIRRHPSMKDAESLGEQAEAVEQEVRRSKIHATEEGARESAITVVRRRIMVWRDPIRRNLLLTCCLAASDKIIQMERVVHQSLQRSRILVAERLRALDAGVPQTGPVPSIVLVPSPQMRCHGRGIWEANHLLL